MRLPRKSNNLLSLENVEVILNVILGRSQIVELLGSTQVLGVDRNILIDAQNIAIAGNNNLGLAGEVVIVVLLNTVAAVFILLDVAAHTDAALDATIGVHAVAGNQVDEDHGFVTDVNSAVAIVGGGITIA